MSALQHRLSEFLDFELQHSLGAYRRTRDDLLGLEKSLEDDSRLGGKTSQNRALGELAALMREYNHILDNEHDAQVPPGVRWTDELEQSGDWDRIRRTRHPSPPRLPMSGTARLWTDERRSGDATSEEALTWVTAFYNTAIHAVRDPPLGRSTTPSLDRLAQALLLQRSDLRHSEIDEVDTPSARQCSRRTARFERRLAEAGAAGVPVRTFAQGDEDPAAVAERTAKTIVESHLESAHHLPLAQFVICAMVDGHLAMHEAESYLSAPLGVQIARNIEAERIEERDRVEKLLRRSIALNTFVWAIARTAPWIFAEDDAEREWVLRFYPRAWRTNMPMRPMWISAQVSLLALHRRAYAHWLLEEKALAYNDFHKLQRHLRETARRLRRAAVHIDGALEFIDSLDALADHHIGELYRHDRDHRSAAGHFERAHNRLERLKGERRASVLVNSRWFVQLQFSLGKSAYELGQHKSSLAWYLRTWRGLMDLIAADMGGETNPHDVDAALAWLDRVMDEPEIHKNEALEYLRPVVDQLANFRVDDRFTALASDIFVRLGHLLFVLNLGEQRSGAATTSSGPEKTAESSTDSDRAARHGALAVRCIRRAWQLDPHSTLALAGLLKIYYRASRAEDPPDEVLRALARLPVGVERQWPGGQHMETVSRAIEYLLHQQLRLTREQREAREPDGISLEEQIDRDIARELLHSFLAHTDSIEARKSQVHEYLTQMSRCTEVPAGKNPAIEFVCLRRYSSAYPILPRPQAFRADGGGYFVRIYPDAEAGHAFGIAIDPGTSYVECLYRSGYALADIDMVIVTHDHVDHASAFEPLLALRHEMNGLITRSAVKPLYVLGNQSVLKRWGPVFDHRLTKRSKVDPRRIEFYALDGRADDLGLISTIVTERVRSLAKDHGEILVEIEALSSKLPGTKGHRDLYPSRPGAMQGSPSSGVLFTVSSDRGPRRTLALTSDLPALDAVTDWPPIWKQAFQADVFVCHLSTLPLAELRRMAKLALPATSDADGDRRRRSMEQLAADIDYLNEVAREPNYSSRLGYAYWLWGHEADEPVGPVGDAKALEAWVLPRYHPYLDGLLTLARQFCVDEPEDERHRLLVIGELSEELGSFRTKIATQLTGAVFRDSRHRAVTADLGLRLVIAAKSDREAHPVRVSCSTCALDNDYAVVERLHYPGEIAEVCVKGENEGTFYFCPEHNPVGSTEDPTFIERHERYDVFGR